MPTAQRIYSMLGNADLWLTASACHRALARAEVPHAICGGVAVCLHGYQRNTVDIDLVVRSEDIDSVRSALGEEGLHWDEARKEFRAENGVVAQFLVAGERAGKGQAATIPDPFDPKSLVEIEGLPVVSLAKLIEMKLASGTGDLRRTHKDFADVVELIALHQLDGSFARFLEKSLRKTYRTLVHHARG